MLKVFVSLSLVAVLVYTSRHLWSERNAEFPFQTEDYVFNEPKFNELERTQAVLGFELFHDQRLSANGEVSCSTCHIKEFGFGDNKAQSKGIGLTDLNSPPIFNTSVQKWFFWDGRSNSLETQALQPIVHPNEHGISLTKLGSLIFQNYKSEFEKAFSYKFSPELGSFLRKKLKANEEAPKSLEKEVNELALLFGKALGQYQRGIVAMDSPFDQFMRSYHSSNGELSFNDSFGSQEWRGFNLFLSKTHCSECHTGKNFSDQKFHFTGLAKADAPGRLEGLAALVASPFSCLGKGKSCQQNLAKLTGSAKQVKTPSLRNLAQTGPYFHDGSAKTVREILYLYNRPDPKAGMDGRIQNLYLTVGEIEDLEAFLMSLTSPIRDLTQEYQDQIAQQSSSGQRLH